MFYKNLSHKRPKRSEILQQIYNFFIQQKKNLAFYFLFHFYLYVCRAINSREISKTNLSTIRSCPMGSNNESVASILTNWLQPYGATSQIKIYQNAIRWRLQPKPSWARKICQPFRNYFTKLVIAARAYQTPGQPNQKTHWASRPTIC